MRCVEKKHLKIFIENVNKVSTTCGWEAERDKHSINLLWNFNSDLRKKSRGLKLNNALGHHHPATLPPDHPSFLLKIYYWLTKNVIHKCHQSRYLLRERDTSFPTGLSKALTFKILDERRNVLLTLGPEAADQFVAWPSVISVMIQLSGAQSLHNHLTWLLFPTYDRLSPDMWRTHIFRTISTISSPKENLRQIVVRSVMLL